MLKIDLKPLGKIYDHLLNNLQITWRRFIVITLMTQGKKTFILWKLKIDSKPLGEILWSTFKQFKDNLEKIYRFTDNSKTT